MVKTQDCPWRKKLLVGEVEDENAWAAGGVEGHAGLFGTALAVHRLCLEIMAAVQGQAGQVLSARVMADFVEKRAGFGRVCGFDTPSKEGSSAGSYYSSASLGHLGFTGTSFWMDPVNHKIIILLTNRVHPSRDNVKIREFRPKIHDAAHGFFS